MKVVTIDIEYVPNSYMRPYLDKVRRKPLKVTAFTEMDVIPQEESTFTRETYPLSEFAMGSHMDRFYIRDKDKLAFEQMINGFVKLGKLQILEVLSEMVEGFDNFNRYERNRVLQLLAEFKDKESL